MYTSCSSNQILQTSQHAYALNGFVAWNRKQNKNGNFKKRQVSNPPHPLIIYFYTCLLKHIAELFLIGTREQNIVYLPELQIVMYTVYTAYCTVLCDALLCTPLHRIYCIFSVLCIALVNFFLSFTIALKLLT